MAMLLCVIGEVWREPSCLAMWSGCTGSGVEGGGGGEGGGALDCTAISEARFHQGQPIGCTAKRRGGIGTRKTTVSCHPLREGSQSCHSS